jgi:hypothetical protein
VSPRKSRPPRRPAATPPADAPAPRSHRRDFGVWQGLAILLAIFVVVTLLAQLLGATNLGTALAFGQIAFMAGVVTLILRGRPGS